MPNRKRLLKMFDLPDFEITGREDLEQKIIDHCLIHTEFLTYKKKIHYVRLFVSYIALSYHKGNKTAAAKWLGMNRTTFNEYIMHMLSGKISGSARGRNTKYNRGDDHGSVYRSNALKRYSRDKAKS
jgi:hypothetical protein